MRMQMKILNKEYYSNKFTDTYDDNGEAITYCSQLLGDVLPKYTTPGSAGIDLVLTEDLILYPGETQLVGTGLAIWIGSNSSGIYPRNARGESLPLDGVCSQFNVAGLLLPRSGLGHKLGLVLGNGTGLIDEDYQGELKVSCWNRSGTDFQQEYVPGGLCASSWRGGSTINLKAGERFAQLVFIPVIKAEFEIVEEFGNNTERGQGGFGSTGAR